MNAALESNKNEQGRAANIEGKLGASRVNELPIKSLFSGLEPKFVSHLKAQRSILKIEKVSDYRDAYSFIYNLSTVKGFTAANVGAVIRYFRDQGMKSLITDEHFEESWRIFREVFDIEDVEKRHALLDHKPASEKSPESESGDKPAKPVRPVEQPKPEVPSRALGLIFGDAASSSLQTHGDKTFEVTQSFDLAQLMIKNIANNASLEVPILHDSKDAIMLVGSIPQAKEPFGVTLSDEDQAELGLVCSPARGFVTGGKGAHLAPKQQFLLLKFLSENEEFSVLSVIIDSRFDIMTKFLGFETILTLSDLRDSLSDDSELSFFATLYFFIHYSISGIYESELKTVFDGLDLNFDVVPRSMVGVVQGSGISGVRIPFGDDYRYITPLQNYGLMVELHQKYDDHKKFDPLTQKEEIRDWRRLFKMVHVGGGQPQNTGAMFSSVISNGDIRALRANVRSQISGYRLLKQNIRRGTPLFFVRKDSALEICSRESIDNVENLVSKIHKRTAMKIARKTTELVDLSLGFLSMVGRVIDNGNISLLEYETSPGNQFACAEREIVLGRYNAKDIAAYGNYLQSKIFKMTNLTKAEKRVVATAIAFQLNKRLGA